MDNFCTASKGNGAIGIQPWNPLVFRIRPGRPHEALGNAIVVVKRGCFMICPGCGRKTLLDFHECKVCGWKYQSQQEREKGPPVTHKALGRPCASVPKLPIAGIIFCAGVMIPQLLLCAPYLTQLTIDIKSHYISYSTSDEAGYGVAIINLVVEALALLLAATTVSRVVRRAALLIMRAMVYIVSVITFLLLIVFLSCWRRVHGVGDFDLILVPALVALWETQWLMVWLLFIYRRI